MVIITSLVFNVLGVLAVYVDFMLSKTMERGRGDLTFSKLQNTSHEEDTINGP